MPRNLTNTNSPTQQNTGAKSKNIELVKDKLNVLYKGYKQQKTKHEKLDRPGSTKTIRIATKVKDSKRFEQKKTINGKILTYTPHTAWVQAFGEQPRLLRNIGAAFAPNPFNIRNMPTVSAQ